nr:DUF3810 domain-containing protein [Maribacter sp. Hal144]
MTSKLKLGIAISLIPQIILVKWLAHYPQLVETYYSKGIYPVISRFFRLLFGWIPFSFGDVLYFLLGVIAIRYVFVNRKRIRAYPLKFLLNIAVVLSVAYFTFHLMWGMNYYRLPIAEKFDLPKTHTKEQLTSFIEKLTTKTNQVHLSITSDSTKAVELPFTKREIFEKTIHSYNDLGNKIPFLKYRSPSLKKSIFSLALTYMGYGGYLNPFTNEAQVNGKLPAYRFPVVAGHEVGHQLGYSAENETNFIGYLATVNNEDVYFKYAAYSYALAYALGELQRVDMPLFNTEYAKLNEGVRKNYKEMNDFWLSYENPMEPVFKSVFNTFLKANNQSEGILSYNSVVSLLVNYYEKHPL